eukprot:scaffold68282_cov28-Tisochrysis_lutea.AAC.1
MALWPLAFGAVTNCDDPLGLRAMRRGQSRRQARRPSADESGQAGLGEGEDAARTTSSEPARGEGERGEDWDWDGRGWPRKEGL